MIKKTVALALAGTLVALSNAARTEPRTVTLAVSNMSCALCPITVKKAITRVPGVLDAKVDYGSQTATVRYESTQTNVEAIAAATGNAGYPSRPVE